MPGRPRKCLLACAGALALGVAGCGGSEEPEKTIPPDAGEAMISSLNAIEASAVAGNCDVVELNVITLMDQIDNLPAEVGVETKEALREVARNAGELASERCAEAGATGEQGAEDDETTTSDTATTAPPPVETDPDVTTDESDTDNGGSSGNQGSGGGNSGGGNSGSGNSGGGNSGGGDTDVGGSGEVTPPSGGVTPEDGG